VLLRRTTQISALASTLLLVTLVGASGASSARSPAGVRFARRQVEDTAVSSNWAGYVATASVAQGQSNTSGLSYTDVAGSWIQPKLSCAAGEVGSAAFWVGLGGSQDTSPALEQTGTEGDCKRNGKVTYSAWYEFVPAGPVTVQLAVRPGDRLTGAVLVSGTRVTVSLKNLTTHKRFSKTFSSISPLDTSSAEWIAEAPSLCSSDGRCAVVPLPNFGTTSFTNAAAVANGHPGTISDPTWSSTSIVLAPDPAAQTSFGLAANVHGAVPSAVSVDGRSFSVSWLQTPVSAK
jgi:hypothetical protein